MAKSKIAKQSKAIKHIRNNQNVVPLNLEIPYKYGKSTIDLTTRAQIEFRHLNLHELPIVLKELESVGITTFQTAGDNFRGVITSPFDGYSKTSLITCEDLIQDIHDVFLKNEEYIGTLPRKFNTGILGDTVNDCNIFGQDCAFVLASKDDELGFNLYLGGKVGVQARPLNLFVKPSQVKEVFSAVISLYKTYGFKVISSFVAFECFFIFFNDLVTVCNIDCFI